MDRTTDHARDEQLCNPCNGKIDRAVFRAGSRLDAFVPGKKLNFVRHNFPRTGMRRVKAGSSGRNPPGITQPPTRKKIRLKDSIKAMNKTASPILGFTRAGAPHTTNQRRPDNYQRGPTKRIVLDRFRRKGTSAIQGGSMTRKRILLVDDEAGFTNILKISLSGFDVCVENNPLHAIETARRFRPDLIFLDVVMPDIDGGTVAAQFKEDLDLGRIPIVFLTAIISEKEASSRQQICGYEFVAKPASLEQIVDCIERHLGTQWPA